MSPFNTLVILPSGIITSIANDELQKLQPKLHLNQVDQNLLKQEADSIYLSGDNWIEMGGVRKSLDDFSPYFRLRRSHYVNDFNSISWQILPGKTGITMRVEFETDGNEIKGYCHNCLKGVGDRDKRAADVNILAPSGSNFPFIEADIGFSITSGEVQLDLHDVKIGMDFDGNGFLELFEGLIGREVRNATKDAIYRGWNQISDKLEAEIANRLKQELEIYGVPLGTIEITDLQFDGDQVRIGLGIDPSNPQVEQVFSYFSHVLESNAKNLTLLGENAIDGTGNTLDNILVGNRAANYLTGLAGSDTIDGGDGADIMQGSTGNDRYVVDDLNDIVIEYLAEGIDAVSASINYTLPEHVENLALSGIAPINGMGNILDNIIDGNDADNVLDGDAGNDTLNGRIGNDSIWGRAGNDSIYGDIGEDTLFGDEGNDHIAGGGNNDQIDGGSGNDILSGDSGNPGKDTVSGGEGDDIIGGGGNDDTLNGDEGDDLIWGDSSFDIIDVRTPADPGAEGNDVIDGGSGDDEIHGEAGDDIIYGGMCNDTLYGDEGNDHLYGSSGNDAIAGGAENDTVHYEDFPGNVIVDLMRGQATDGFGTTDMISEVENIIGSDIGDDILIGNENDNSISGSGGNDHLLGNEGNDFLNGGAGNDILDGGEGIDTASFADATSGVYINFETGEIRGNAGNDQLISIENLGGTEFADVIIGDATENTLSGLGGNDVIAGGMGRDVIYGGDGDDVLRGDRNAVTGGIASGDADIIYGGNGNDQLGGKAGDDQLFGDAGDDELWGDDGDDLLRGGLGNDELRGGKGRDTYVLAIGEGTDIFHEFRLGEDRLGLVDGLTFDQLTFEKIGGGTMVYAGDESLAFVRYAKPSDFTANPSSLFTTVV
jgi:Ca2+-binding RTX toxin-like protein